MSKSNTSNLSWDSSISGLCSNPKKPTKTALRLIESNILSIKELLWILPLRVIKLPQIESFESMKIDQYFKGSGKVISINLTPAFGKKGKHKIQLFNATVVIQDNLSNSFLNLKWFNAYPNLKNQLEALEEFSFLGIVQDYKGILQIINPSLNQTESTGNLLIEYPTVSTISGNNIKKLIQKIPQALWKVPIKYFSEELSLALKTNPLNTTFQTLHGLDKDYSLKDSKEPSLI